MQQPAIPFLCQFANPITAARLLSVRVVLCFCIISSFLGSLLCALLSIFADAAGVAVLAELIIVKIVKIVCIVTAACVILI